MSNSLGTGSLVLTADASGLTGGVQKAKSLVSSIGSTVAGGVSKGGLLGGAVAGSLAGILSVEKALDKLRDIADISTTASAFGTTGEKMSELAAIASRSGINFKEFKESLVTTGSKAADAIGGATGAVQMFNDLGIDPKAFALLPIEEQFYQMHSAILGIEDPAKRVRAVMNAFGEDGGKLLLPILEKSNKELREFGKANALSATEINGAVAANRAYTEVTGALDRAWTQLVIAGAPVVQLVAEALTPAIEALGVVFKSLKGVAVGVFTAIGMTFGYVYDTIKSGVGFLAAGVGKLAGTLGKALSAVGQTDIGDRLQDGARQVEQWGVNAFNSWGQSANDIESYFDSWEKKRDAGLAKTTAKAKENAVAVAKVATISLAPLEATLKGSKEALSKEIKWRQGGGVGDMATKQLQEQKKATGLLAKIERAVSREPVVFGTI